MRPVSSPSATQTSQPFLYFERKYDLCGFCIRHPGSNKNVNILNVTSAHGVMAILGDQKAREKSFTLSVNDLDEIVSPVPKAPDDILLSPVIESGIFNKTGSSYVAGRLPYADKQDEDDQKSYYITQPEENSWFKLDVALFETYGNRLIFDGRIEGQDYPNEYNKYNVYISDHEETKLFSTYAKNTDEYTEYYPSDYYSYIHQSYWYSSYNFLDDFRLAPSFAVLRDTYSDSIIDLQNTVAKISSIDEDSNTHIYSLVDGKGDIDNNQFEVKDDFLLFNPGYSFMSDWYAPSRPFSVRIQSTDETGLSIQKQLYIFSEIYEGGDLYGHDYCTSLSIDDLIISNTSFDENLYSGSVITTLSTASLYNDLECQVELLLYEYYLVSGSGDTDNSAFTIDGDQLKINASPDYETQDSYSIRLQTKDSSGLTFEKSFTLSVNDLEEVITPVPPETPEPPITPEPGSTNGLAVASSSFSDNLITLVFDAEIASSKSRVGRFNITDGTKKLGVASIKCSSNEVHLKLKKNIQTLDYISLNYTDSEGDQKKGVIQNLKGSDLPSISDLEIANSIPPQNLTTPTVAFAENLVTLEFGQELGVDKINSKLFSIETLDGEKIKIGKTAVDQNNKRVTITSLRDIGQYDSLLISYTDKSQKKWNRIQSTTGNPLESFSDIQATNQISPVKLTTLTVAFLGNLVTVDFDQELGIDKVDSKLFSMKTLDGEKIKIGKTAVDQSNKRVSITPLRDISQYDSLLISYTDKSQKKWNRIQSTTGNPLESFSDIQATNQISPVKLTTLTVAFLGNLVTVDFDQELGIDKVDSKLFSMKTLDGEKIKIGKTAVDQSNKRVSITPLRDISQYDSLLISYTDKSQKKWNRIQSTTGNPLESFSDMQAINQKIPADLSIDSIESGFSQKFIEIKVDGQMDPTSPKSALFKVSSPQSRFKVTSAEVNVDSNTIRLSLNKDVSTLDNLLVSYRAPRKDQIVGVVQSVTGNDLQRFEELMIDNLVVDNKHPRLESAKLRKKSKDILLTFNEELAPGNINRNLFAVKWFGTPAPLSDVEIIGKNKVSIQLGFHDLQSVYKNNAPFLDYMQGERKDYKDVIEDLRGNDLAVISDYRISI